MSGRLSPIILGTCLVALVACEAEKPEWLRRYEKARAEADNAFASNHVARASELYRSAAEALPEADPRKAECLERLAICRFLDLKERATQLVAQGQRNEAILALESARNALPEDDSRVQEVDNLIKKLKYELRMESARETMAKKAWLDAAKEFEAAQSLAAESEGEDARELQEFCERFAAAENVYLVEKDLAKAQVLYKELLKAPRSFEKDISERLRMIEEEMTNAEEAAAAKKKQQFDEAVAKGKALLAQAEWAKAREVLESVQPLGLSSPEYEAMLQVARSAANPPEGFVYVAEGEFTFGLGPASAPTGPEQKISTPAFYISKREVTNGEYKKFLESYRDHSKCHQSESESKKKFGHVPEGWSEGSDPLKAVTGVDWFDAWAYAQWAGGELPSEVEWEKAAGWDPVTGKKSVYPWGDDYSSGTGGASPCGAEGMGGGVLEWLKDSYQPYPGGEATDVDFGESRRVVRGGVFLEDDVEEDLKVTRRFRFLPDRRDRSLGFRVVKRIRGAEK